VDFSRRSLLVVVSFVVVAAVAGSRCRCHCRPVGGVLHGLHVVVVCC
jgi:hypothetical protein